MAGADQGQVLAAYGDSLSPWEEKYPEGGGIPFQKDKDELFAFYYFPAVPLVAHQDDQPHLNSTNGHLVRLRTKKTKGCGSRMATLTMVSNWPWKRRKWRWLTGTTDWS